MRPEIAVVGARGKTGRAVVEALLQRGCPVRKLVRAPARADDEVAVDLLDPAGLRQACTGVAAVYHLAPNVHPAEGDMARAIVDAVRACGVARLVYHSVLRPQLAAMPHHWEKLRVEEMLFSHNDLAVTVLQPAPYMQNFTNHPRTQPLRVPYRTDAAFSFVDLADIAQVAAQVLTDDGHTDATYELAGPEQLSVHDVAHRLGVAVQAQSAAEWEREARVRGMPDYAIDSLAKMFRYYDSFGLRGNPRVLAALLGRAPTTLDEVLDRTGLRNQDGLETHA